jgi:hypothetical protein
MDSATFTASVSGAVAIVTATISVGLTYLLTKKREQESDWRKMKLDLYRAYVLALSGVVKASKTPEDQTKYADALNSLTLAAPAAVLRALYAFQDAAADRAGTGTPTNLEKRLNDVLKALRQDLYPRSNRRGEPTQFRLMSPPPQSEDALSHPKSGR